MFTFRNCYYCLSKWHFFSGTNINYKNYNFNDNLYILLFDINYFLKHTKIIGKTYVSLVASSLKLAEFVNLPLLEEGFSIILPLFLPPPFPIPFPLSLSILFVLES